MVVEWLDKAQQHWIEQAKYCAQTFGGLSALDLAKKAEEKIERICKFPESGTREPLLNDKEMVYRYMLVHKRVKLIYRYDEELQTIFIEDVWNTKILPEHLLKGMK